MDDAGNGLIHRQKVLVWVSDAGEARELQNHIVRLGWEVESPGASVTDPAKFLTDSSIDVAILDTDLRELKLSDWVVACQKHGVPLVLIKRYDSYKLVDPTLKSARRIYKPFDESSIRRTVTRATQERTRNLIAHGGELLSRAAEVNLTSRSHRERT